MIHKKAPRNSPPMWQPIPASWQPIPVAVVIAKYQNSFIIFNHFFSPPVICT